MNLSSSDVERFERAVGLWPYLVYGPIEVVFVFFAVSLFLGFIPATAGMGCIFVLIPAQVMLQAIPLHLQPVCFSLGSRNSSQS